MAHHTIHLDVKARINGKKEGLGLRWYIGRALMDLACTLMNVTVDIEYEERR